MTVRALPKCTSACSYFIFLFEIAWMLNDFIIPLGTFCGTSLCECPLLKKYQEALRKSSSYHDQLLNRVIDEGCSCKSKKVSTSRIQVPKRSSYFETEKLKMLKDKSNELEKSRTEKECKSVSSTILLGSIRSTRAQDLRSQSNRDLLLKPKPKTNEKKLRSSPYVSNSTAKPKLFGLPTKNANAGKKTAEQPKKLPNPEIQKLERERTRDLINPKIFIKRADPKVHKNNELSASTSRETLPKLKKSQTFVICRGPKPEEKPGRGKKFTHVKTDSETEESPRLRPLTHNDSFCLITKSSRNWSQKNKSESEIWPNIDINPIQKNKRKTDKGILKTSNFTLKSVDSSEKVEPEKIVRFSDEQQRQRKLFRIVLRKKRRLQSALTAAWCKKNKLLQKHFQMLRSKSASQTLSRESLLSLRPLQMPIHMRKRYDAEIMFLPSHIQCIGSKRKRTETPNILHIR